MRYFALIIGLVLLFLGLASYLVITQWFGDPEGMLTEIGQLFPERTWDLHDAAMAYSISMGVAIAVGVVGAVISIFAGIRIIIARR